MREREREYEREREGERESFFVMDNLEGICVRCGNEVIRNLYEN